MARFLATIRGSRPLQLISVLVILIVTYLLLPASSDDESYTPEQLNSILQNKDKTVVSIKKVELTAQDLSQPYLDASSFKVKNWDLAGNTLIKNKDYIRLTSDRAHQVGNMFAKMPIQAESFEMELTFHIHSRSSHGLIGDGFAVWLLDRKSDIGDVFGVQNNFNGLGVMLDTYKNGKRGHFPFVNLMLGDGRTRYNKGTDGYETRLAGCTAKGLVNPSSKETKMRLVYIKNGYLSVDFNYNGKHEEWTNCVTLTDVVLPRIKYLGFSAETGQLSENVDVIENKMYALYKPNGEFVGSIEELHKLIDEQAEFENDLKEVIEDKQKRRETGTQRNRVFKKTRSTGKRKSLQRLRNSEKRIKERERKLRLELYGDENATFPRRVLSTVLTTIKFLIYAIITILLVWFAFIVYRVQRQRRKSKTTGLLD
ncbi:concanavalin A-like lectin/glucanase domain-containing protein [Scheffersomyces xylosifermentans]|uniref:concanavalin A-like lectin/glucanase domain-containing protein n=1 Tax=Scheffersomyces xylosifermentans TaxID=1304137 RepID=UPI00315DFC47